MQDEESERQFRQKVAKVMYKTTAQGIGFEKSKSRSYCYVVPVEHHHGINGKFTDHLIYSGMVKNASLNTIAEKDRWLSGSKDWMQHLG